ncbi:fatty acid synthase, putative [Ixodes scapularis]|uniref:Fatty acid synthase, putative n=1 Tax=Ixodes scapularis TaxID=6945 RepID=B7P4V0_IXOSC|nr:fatty acid synthase, putative [Ixodes scapularis]|eukprot:XP_002406467.1 fatty acid synthase, putative [Ixodes scapularis]
MGCQWSGMARQMMQFDVFANSIRRSHELLVPLGIDLVGLITSDNANNQTMVSPYVSIAAVQVALVSMLKTAGVEPDGIVGHSLGEIGCGFADGALTAEQTVMCAYWRGRCAELGNLPKGAMAAVGLTWEQAKQRCRNGVTPACHNAEDSVTVSGPAEAVAELVAQLKRENVFAREVNSLGVAFHSRYMQPVGLALQEALEKSFLEDLKKFGYHNADRLLPQGSFFGELFHATGADSPRRKPDSTEQAGAGSFRYQKRKAYPLGCCKGRQSPVYP